MDVYLQANFGKKHFGFTYSKRVDLTLQDVLLGKLEGTDLLQWNPLHGQTVQFVPTKTQFIYFSKINPLNTDTG